MTRGELRYSDVLLVEPRLDCNIECQESQSICMAESEMVWFSVSVLQRRLFLSVEVSKTGEHVERRGLIENG